MRTLLLVLKNRIISFLVIGCLFAIAVVGLGTVPNIFFPANDRATFTLEVELPVGTPLARTDQVTREIEAFMRSQLRADGEQGGITTWATFIGSGAPRFSIGYGPKRATRHWSAPPRRWNQARLIMVWVRYSVRDVGGS